MQSGQTVGVQFSWITSDLCVFKVPTLWPAQDNAAKTQSTAMACFSSWIPCGVSCVHPDVVCLHVHHWGSRAWLAGVLFWETTSLGFPALAEGITNYSSVCTWISFLGELAGLLAYCEAAFDKQFRAKLLSLNVFIGVFKSSYFRLTLFACIFSSMLSH